MADDDLRAVALAIEIPPARNSVRYEIEIPVRRANAAAQLCSMEIDNTVSSDGLTEDRITKIRLEIEKLFCGLACKIASRLAGCSEDLQKSLERFGRSVGEAWFWTTHPSGGGRATQLHEQAAQALADVPDCSAKSELLSVSLCIIKVFEAEGSVF